MIVSRAAELSRLDDLLTALAGGEGGALVVRGEAGIGKTTLLETLTARVDDAVTVRESAKGNYLAVHVTCMLASEEQRKAVYAKLHGDPNVVFML